MDRSSRVVIIGAGPVGVVLAIYLAHRGISVSVFEGRPDPRRVKAPGGRSINLTVASRGWKAFADVGVDEAIRAIALPLTSRAIHHRSGEVEVVPYGDHGECLHAVSRHQLTVRLIEAAAKHAKIELHFGHRLLHLDVPTGLLQFDRPEGGEPVSFRATVVLACDGSHSTARSWLLRNREDHFKQSASKHWYKEIRIPSGLEWAFSPTSTHIWPRDEGMFVAFPNIDRTFGGSLFLPIEGPGSFATLTTRDAVKRFFKEHYPEVLAAAPDLPYSFFSQPTSALFTTTCEPWTWAGRFAVVGDAARSMVPFLGQGMNAGLQDCRALADCIDQSPGDWSAILENYANQQREEGRVISELAEEHYGELSFGVADPGVKARRAIESKLYALEPRRFVPLYHLVSFTLLPYALARRQQEVQSGLVGELQGLLADGSTWDDPGFMRIVEERLAELPVLPESAFLSRASTWRPRT